MSVSYFRQVQAQVLEGGNSFGGVYQASKNWDPPRDPKAIEKLHQFQDLKFGIMYNWGLQTQFGTVDQSWSLCPERYDWNKRPAPYENADWATYKKVYEDLQKTFNPVKFDPEKDARIIASSGAKYILVDSKHHDGFCFFDTKTTDYKITSPICPFSTNKNANVVKVMLEAGRKIIFGLVFIFQKLIGTHLITVHHSLALQQPEAKITSAMNILKFGLNFSNLLQISFRNLPPTMAILTCFGSMADR